MTKMYLSVTRHEKEKRNLPIHPRQKQRLDKKKFEK